jgi:Transposase DDE domain
MTYLLGIIQDSRYFSVHGLSQKTTGQSKESLYKLLQMRINWEKILYTFASPFLQSGKWYLVIDGSPLEQPFARFRIAKHAHVSTKSMKYVPPNQVISLILTNGTIQLVLDYKIWVSPKVAKPGDYKKITVLALELLKRAKFLKLPVKEVLFDNYFACKKILDWLNEDQYTWVTRLKGNRIVYINGTPSRLDELNLSTGESIVAELKGVQGQVRILRLLYQDEVVYVATNLVNVDNQELKRRYGIRWDIEVYHREAKQQLGLEYLWMRNYRALYNHVGFVCLAYSLLSALRSSRRLTLGGYQKKDPG